MNCGIAEPFVCYNSTNCFFFKCALISNFGYILSEYQKLCYCSKGSLRYSSDQQIHQCYFSKKSFNFKRKNANKCKNAKRTLRRFCCNFNLELKKHFPFYIFIVHPIHNETVLYYMLEGS